MSEVQSHIKGKTTKRSEWRVMRGDFQFLKLQILLFSF